MATLFLTSPDDDGFWLMNFPLAGQQFLMSQRDFLVPATGKVPQYLAKLVT